MVESEAFVKMSWISLISWLRSLFQSKECSCCEQLRLDLAYERAEKEKFFELWNSLRVAQPIEPRKPFDFISTGRGHATMSRIKSKVQAILDSQEKDNV